MFEWKEFLTIFFIFKKSLILLDDSNFGKEDEVEHICFGQKHHPRAGVILCAARLGIWNLR